MLNVNDDIDDYDDACVCQADSIYLSYAGLCVTKQHKLHEHQTQNTSHTATYVIV